MTATDVSTRELVHLITEQTSRLVRDEVQLAKAELADKGKKAGLGGGLFAGAALVAVFGVGALVTAAILALAGPLPGWAAALIVAASLFAVAGLAAFIGKREVVAATPPVPEQAVASAKLDLDTVKAGAHR